MKIKVKSHKRTRKNGVSVVRQHMKKSLKSKVKSEIKRYDKSLSEMAAIKAHPKTGRARLALTNIKAKTYLNSHNPFGKSNGKRAKRKK